VLSLSQYRRQAALLRSFSERFFLFPFVRGQRFEKSFGTGPVPFQASFTRVQFSPSQVTTVPWPLVLEGKSSYRYDIVDSDRGGAIPKSRRRALRLASQSFARAEPSPGDTETEVRFPFNNSPVGIVNHRRGVV